MHDNVKASVAHLLLFVLLLTVGSRVSVGQERVEFDSAFLRGGAVRGLDVSRYSQDNPVPPGEYDSDIYVNDNWKGKTRLLFKDSASEGASILCSNDSILSLLDLDSAAISEKDQQKNADACAPLKSLIPKADINYRLDAFRLDVSIPQAYVRSRPRGYISPDTWQSGVPSAFVNYNYNFYQSTATQLGQTNNSHFLNLNGGFNLGNWHFRHRGTLNWGSANQYEDSASSRYRSYANYLQRDIPVLKSQIMLGDFSTDGRLFENMSVRGVQLFSDDQMLPESIRGFAPVVRGVAQGNAKVTIVQNSNVIYETTVPPGPFEINDLYASGYGGDLNVTVTEADGSARTFTVPATQASQMLRPGNLRYQIAAGQFRFGATTFDEKVLQASVQYGVNNWLTLNAGFNGSRRFQSVLVGGVFNTPLGALGLDLISSHSQISDGMKESRVSWRVNYSNYIARTKTSLALTATRYASTGFTSVQNAILQSHQDVLTERSEYLLDRQKNQLQLSLNQPFSDKWGSMYLTGYMTDYWSRSGRNVTVAAGYTNSYKGIGYTLSFSRTRDYYSGKSDNSVLLSISIPLEKNTFVTTQVGQRTSAGAFASSALSGTAGDNNQYSYGASVAHDSSGTTGSANAGYRSSYGVFNASMGAGREYRQLGASASGAVIVHPKGISFSEQVGDTFAIISAPGAEGARIAMGTNAKLGADGVGIVPYLNPYNINRVGIDPQEASENVDFDATSQQVIPRANSAMLVELKTKTGTGVLFQSRLADDSFPPMGTDVVDEEGNMLGFVAQQGQIFVRGPKANGVLILRWGSADNEQCKAPYSIDPATLSKRQNDAELIRVKIQCK